MRYVLCILNAFEQQTSRSRKRTDTIVSRENIKKIYITVKLYTALAFKWRDIAMFI